MKSKTGLWIGLVFTVLCLLPAMLYFCGDWAGDKGYLLNTEESLRLEKELSVLQFRLEEQMHLSDSLMIEIQRYEKQYDEIQKKMEALRAYHDSVVVAVYLLDVNGTVDRLREWLSEDCSHRE
jgi:ABC-type phosphate transport system auxiliary subunit